MKPQRGPVLAFMALVAALGSPRLPAADSAVALMYHRFGENEHPATNIRIEQFEAQLELLRMGGFSVIPLADLIQALRAGKPLPPKAVVITIDDAYRSIYDIAYPRLREYGFPFTVFVATDGVDQGFSAYMSWEQMREMAGHGVTFANHGAGHVSTIARLHGESDDDRISRILADIDKGRQRLVQELQPLPNVFAYPYGEFDSKIANRLLDLGYVSFGQHSGAIGHRSDPRALPRFPVAEAFADIEGFKVKVSSLPLPVVDVTPWEPVVAEARPEIAVTLGDFDAPLDRLACFVSGQGRVPVFWIQENRTFTVHPQRPLGPGRHRVNCTVPGNEGRYFWHSHPWFVEAR